MTFSPGLEGNHLIEKRDMGSDRSASCTDPFAIFSFLAFALAVANLVMNMNAGGGKRFDILFFEISNYL